VDVYPEHDDGGQMNAAKGTPPMIVVGVDGSDPSRRALRWAADQAKLVGAELEAVTTWEYPPTLGWAPPYPSDFDPNEDARKALRDTVDAVLGPDPGVVVHLTVTEGHPAFVLTKAAQAADLLVVGSRGHGAFAGMLLGSVSEYCAAHAPCPVVVVRHAEDKP
jgi:nucleotide-binding universal stress UspA family protein